MFKSNQKSICLVLKDFTGPRLWFVSMFMGSVDGQHGFQCSLRFSSSASWMGTTRLAHKESSRSCWFLPARLQPVLCCFVDYGSEVAPTPVGPHSHTCATVSRRVPADFHPTSTGVMFYVASRPVFLRHSLLRSSCTLIILLLELLNLHLSRFSTSATLD